MNRARAVETLAPHAGARLLVHMQRGHARLMLETGPGLHAADLVLQCDAYGSMDALLGDYLACDAVRTHLRLPVRHAAIALDGEVDGDAVHLARQQWTFSLAALRARFGISAMLAVDDLTALTIGAPALPAGQRFALAAGTPQPGGQVAVLSSGALLRWGGAVADCGRYECVDSTGLRLGYEPGTDDDARLMRALWNACGRVSLSRLLSAAGLESIYHALANRPVPAARIVLQALAGSCAMSVRAVGFFLSALGAVAGDLAAQMDARGGVYISGSTLPLLGELFERSDFSARYQERAARLSGHDSAPAYLVNDGDAIMQGMSGILGECLRQHG